MKVVELGHMLLMVNTAPNKRNTYITKRTVFLKPVLIYVSEMKYIFTIYGLQNIDFVNLYMVILLHPKYLIVSMN